MTVVDAAERRQEKPRPGGRRGLRRWRRKLARLRVPMPVAVLLSLLVHAWLSMLQLEGQGPGLPSLGWPWQERRAVVPELRMVLAPAPGQAPLAVPEPPAQARAPGLPSQPTRLDPARPSADAAQAEQAPAPGPSVRVASQIVDVPQVNPVPAGAEASEAETVVTDAPDAPRWPLPPEPARPTPLPAAQPAASSVGRAAQRQVQESVTQPVETAVDESESRRIEAQVLRLQAEAAAAERAETARREAERLEAERLEAEQQRAIRLAAEKLETERQEAAQQEAAREEALRLESARRETARQEAARQEVARQEAVRKEAARQEAARQEAARQEAAQQEAARQAESRQEVARHAAARQEAARLEAERQQAAALAAADRAAAVRAEAARTPTQDDQARREAILRRIGQQLNDEADRRTAAEAAARAGLAPDNRPHAWSTARRGRLFGRADPNTEMVLYAEAWARRIQLNTAPDLVRDLGRRPHTRPMVTVALRADGSVESVTFVVSSGVAEVDDAIRRIIDSQRPYQAFSPALARQYDVIEIRRTWHFDNTVWLY